MKNIKKAIAVLLILTTMTGCVKYNNTMTINNDKSMLFEGTYLISDKVMDMMNSFGETATTTITENIDKEELKKRGITVNDKKENGYTGISISKKYDSIDNISNDTGKEVLISDYIENGFDDSVLFKIEKGFLKNKYTAKFSYDTETQNENNGLTSYVPTNNKQLAMGNNIGTTTPNTGTTNDNTTNNITGNTTNDNTVTGDNNVPSTKAPETTEPDYSDLMNLASEMEFKFTVNLPEKAISNNATKTDNDGKTLVWNIENNKKTTIEFTFELKNMTNYYILYGGIAAGVIIVIIIIMMIIKKRKGKEVIPVEDKPIHADFDPSIAAAIPNPALVNGNITPQVNNEVAGVTQETVNSPIGNTNTEAQAHIIPEVAVEPQVVVQEAKPTFITPDNTKEEPIVIKEQTPEVKIDTPQTIDMNQN